MSALHRRSGVRCLLGLGLGFALSSAEAAPGWHRHGLDHSHGAPAKHASAVRTGPSSAKPAPRGLEASKPASTQSDAPKPVATGRTATWTSAEGERACFRSRRKLWQGTEGWVVKKVSVCP